MTLNYQDVVTADLSFFTDVAGAWKKMGERFGELKTDYAQNVQAMLTNGNWQGEAFGAQQNSAAATAFEFGAAKAEALAIASLLTDAQTELTRLQKAVKELVADAEKKDYTVDNAGKATYVGYDNLSAQEKYAFQHDPDHTRLLADAREKAQGWTDTIAKAVKAVDDADQSVKRALSRATNDVSMDGTGIGGFNSRAEGDLAKAGKPDPKPGKKDGWVAETDSEASGPGVGTDASGPNIGKGKLAEAEAHADLGRAKGRARSPTVRRSWPERRKPMRAPRPRRRQASPRRAPRPRPRASRAARLRRAARPTPAPSACTAGPRPWRARKPGPTRKQEWTAWC